MMRRGCEMAERELWVAQEGREGAFGDRPLSPVRGRGRLRRDPARFLRGGTRGRVPAPGAPAAHVCVKLGDGWFRRLSLGLLTLSKAERTVAGKRPCNLGGNGEHEASRSHCVYARAGRGQASLFACAYIPAPVRRSHARARGHRLHSERPSPDPSPQVQPDPVPQPTSAPSARRQGPSSAAPAPVRTVSAPVTSTPATVPVQRPAARASAHPGGGHRYRSLTSRAGRRLSPLLSGLRLTRLQGLAPPAPEQRAGRLGAPARGHRPDARGDGGWLAAAYDAAHAAPRLQARACRVRHWPAFAVAVVCLALALAAPVRPASADPTLTYGCDPPLPRAPENCAIWLTSAVTIVWSWDIKPDPVQGCGKQVIDDDADGLRITCEVMRTLARH